MKTSFNLCSDPGSFNAVYTGLYNRSQVPTRADQGRIQGGGGAHPARAPPKIGKNMIFFGL